MQMEPAATRGLRVALPVADLALAFPRLASLGSAARTGLKIDPANVAQPPLFPVCEPRRGPAAGRFDQSSTR